MSLSATPFPLFTFPQRVCISLIWHLINNGPCFPQIFLQPNPIILGVWSLICLRSEHCGIKTQRKSCSDSMANQIWICISDMRFHTNTHRWGVGISRHHIGCTVIAKSGSDQLQNLVLIISSENWQHASGATASWATSINIAHMFWGQKKGNDLFCW